MDHTQSEFLLQIEELLDLIYNDLDALRDVESDGPRRRELIDRLFRNVHSVKGSAASCGLSSVSKIAHEFESLLDAARAGRINLDDVALDLCNNATDGLSENLGLSVSRGVTPPRAQLIESLQAVARGTGSFSDAAVVLKRVPAEIRQRLTDAERYRLASAIKEASGVFILSTSFNTARFDEEFFSLKERLAEWGEVISTSPIINEHNPDQINFRILYASAIEANQLNEKLGQFPGVFVTRIQIAAASEPTATSSVTSSISAMANFIRTDLDTLDRLISSTHELFRNTSAAFDLATTPAQHNKLGKLHQEIKDSFLAVEEELISLRMVSLGPSLQRAARAGKAAARSAGKEIDFAVRGGDLRIDKLLADAIADPLIHLCRNAVDHGIDQAERRVEAGKTRRGTIRIEALSEGGRLRVRVADDGRGIDPEVISAAAKRLGIFDSQSDLDFERSLRLIFRPGFTTVDKVSDLSGRGVGLDVVETAVEQAGGELRVSSKPGVGTTFEIRLPVTFGLMDAMVLVAGGNRYCIAASQSTISDQTGNSQLPQISLQDLLGQSAKQTVSLRTPSPPQTDDNSPKAGKLIALKFTDEQNGATKPHEKRVALLVDAIEGTEKVLVRSLGRHAGRWYGVAGATELRDGSVALVLDLPRLLSNLE